MLIKRSSSHAVPLGSEITPQAIYEERRQFIAKMALGAVAGSALWEMANREAFAQTPAGTKIAASCQRPVGA